MKIVIRSFQILYFIVLGQLYGVFKYLYIKITKQKINKNIKALVLQFTLEKIGPTAIKFGQILSSRPDLIGADVAKYLIQLQTQVRPIPTKQVVKIIEDSFSQPLENIFAKFSKYSIASGSIAQIHQATTHAGYHVAVKIKRPGLNRIITLDFDILNIFAKIVNQFKQYSNFPLTDILVEIKSSILEQLNFKEEVVNAFKIKQNFQGHDYLKIPNYILDLCNNNVITMEYIKELNNINFKSEKKSNNKKMAITGLKMLYKMIFIDGFIHADLHMGNIRFQKNQIILIDFGLKTTLTKELRLEFREFFFAMATNNGPLCAKIIIQTAESLPPDFNQIAFSKTMAIRLNEFSGQAVIDFEVAKFSMMLFDIQRQYKIRGSTHFTMTIISLLMFEGVLKQIDDKMDFQNEAVKFLLNLKDTAYSQSQRELVYTEMQLQCEQYAD